MKSVLIFLRALCSVSICVAQQQIKSGVYSLSGSIMYSSTSSEVLSSRQTRTNFVLSPGASFFLDDRIELTGAAFYSRMNSETNATGGVPYSSGITSTSISVRLGLRQYIPMETIAVFVGANGGLSWFKYDGSFGTGSFSPPNRTYAIEVGLDYFLNQVLALEPSMQYLGAKSDFNSDAGISVSVGVKYFIL